MIIKNIEFFFPKNKLTYKNLNKKFPKWKINTTQKITGIENLYFVDKNQTSLDLAINAIKKIKNFKLLRNKIDGLIFCTQTPNRFIPSNSSILHGILKLRESCFTLDISHGCSGYIYGLTIAKKLLENNTCKNILLINSDTYSKIINPKDRMTKVIFSDAASVTHLQKSKKINIFTSAFGSSGENFNKLTLEKGGFESRSKKNSLNMDGMGIMSFVNSKVPDQITNLLKKNKLLKRNIKFFIFHQASKIAIDSLVRILELDKKKVIYDLKDGNTVSASIPIALKKIIENKKLKRGDLILLSGFGVGLSWATALIRY